MNMSLDRRGADDDGRPAEPRTPGVGWFVAACFGSVALIATFVLAGGGWLGGIRPAPSQQVFELSGTGNLATSAEFTLPASWELRWEHHGTLQEIAWLDPAGKATAFVAMHRKPIREHGSINVSAGGPYRFRVTGTGPWKIAGYALLPLSRDP